MRTTLQHIMIASAAIVVLLVSCSKDEAEVIPRKKMAKIYAEMLVTDQWITSTQGARLVADTSLVYEPILEKYGYDSDDYRKSIDKYMDDPERFARIIRTTGEILDERLSDLMKEKKRLDAIARLPKIEFRFKLAEHVPFWVDEPYVHYYDSLDVQMDRENLKYVFSPIERADTVYDGLRMVKPCDPSSMADSLAVNTDSSIVVKPEEPGKMLKRPNFNTVKIDPERKIRLGK